MIVEAIGLGMVASFALTETVGLAAGGIVVPGYFALTLTEPVRVVMTLLVALGVLVVLKILDRYTLLFGRRLLLISVLVGYLLGYATKTVQPVSFNGAHFELSVIGYAIPGLVAYWMHRQGVIETVATMFIAAVLTRLVITVISGGAF